MRTDDYFKDQPDGRKVHEPEWRDPRTGGPLSLKGVVVGLVIAAFGLATAWVVLDTLGGGPEGVRPEAPVVTPSPSVVGPDVEPGDQVIRRRYIERFLDGYAKAFVHQDTLYQMVIDRVMAELTAADCLTMFDGPFGGPTEDDPALAESLKAARQNALSTAPYEHAFVVTAIEAVPDPGTGVVAFTLGVSCR